MKYRLILIILTVISCKTDPKKPVELRINSNGIEIHEMTKLECDLTELKNTTDYKNELKKYTKINGDTLIEIEKKKIGINNYRTVFDLKENENSLWLLRESSNKKTDSILLHYEDNVEYFLKIDSEFDFKNCEIKIKEEVYYNDSKPEKSEIKTIKF